MADFDLASVNQPPAQHSGELLSLDDSTFLLLGGWTRGYLNTCEVDAYSRDCYVGKLTHESPQAAESKHRVTANWQRCISRNADCLLPPRGSFSAVKAAGAVWLFGGGSLWSDGNTYNDLMVAMPTCLLPQPATSSSCRASTSPAALPPLQQSQRGTPHHHPHGHVDTTPNHGSTTQRVLPGALWADVTWSDVETSDTPPAPRQNHTMVLLPRRLHIDCAANAARGRAALSMAGVWAAEQQSTGTATGGAAGCHSPDLGSDADVTAALEAGVFQEQLLLFGGQSSVTAWGDMFLLAVEVRFPPSCPELCVAGRNTPTSPGMQHPPPTLDELLAAAHLRFEATGTRQEVFISARWQRLHVAPASRPGARFVPGDAMPEVSSHCAEIVNDRMWILGGVQWAGMGATVNNAVFSVELPGLLWNEEAVEGDAPAANHPPAPPSQGSRSTQEVSLATRVAMVACEPCSSVSAVKLSTPLPPTPLAELGKWAVKHHLLSTVDAPVSIFTQASTSGQSLSTDLCRQLVAAGLVSQSVLHMSWLLRDNGAAHAAVVPSELGIGRLGRFAAASVVLGQRVLVHGGWAFADDHGLEALDTDDKSWDPSVLEISPSGADSAAGVGQNALRLPSANAEKDMTQFFRPAEQLDWAVRCGTSLIMSDVHTLQVGHAGKAVWYDGVENLAGLRLGTVGPRMGHYIRPVKLGGRQFMFAWGGHNGVCPDSGARLVPLDDKPWPSTQNNRCIVGTQNTSPGCAKSLLLNLRDCLPCDFALRVLPSPASLSDETTIAGAPCVQVHRAVWLAASGAMQAQARAHTQQPGLFTAALTASGADPCLPPACANVVGQLSLWELLVAGLYDSTAFAAKLKQLPVPQLCRLLAILDERNIECLVPLLEAELGTRLDVQCVCDVLGAADSAGLAGLMDTCAAFMCQRWQELVQAEVQHFQQTPLMSCQEHGFAAHSEQAPLLWALDWLQHRPPTHPIAAVGGGAAAEGVPDESAQDDGSARSKRPRRASAMRAASALGQLSDPTAPPPRQDSRAILTRATAMAADPFAGAQESGELPHPVYVWVAQSILLGSFLGVPAATVCPQWSPTATALYS